MTSLRAIAASVSTAFVLGCGSIAVQPASGSEVRRCPATSCTMLAGVPDQAFQQIGWTFKDPVLDFAVVDRATAEALAGPPILSSRLVQVIGRDGTPGRIVWVVAKVPPTKPMDAEGPCCGPQGRFLLKWDVVTIDAHTGLRLGGMAG